MAELTSAADLLRREAKRELARRHLADFCCLMDEDFVLHPHTKVVIESLERFAAGEITRLIVSMPTQHGKTFICSQCFPAWYLGRNPKCHVIIASFGSKRAHDVSFEVRKLVEDDRWPFEGVYVDPRSSAVDLWSLTTGGKVRASGVEGGLGGFGGHLLILDDPFKDAADADSTTISEATWIWFQQVFMRRQRADARFLIATTRWNDYDVVGRILATPGGKDWTVLNLPGIAKPTSDVPDPLGRAAGEVLWPTGPALPSVAKGEISSRGFAAMVQGEPHPDTGIVFNRKWFSRRLAIDNLPVPTRTIMTVDGAWKEGVGHSRSAIALWGTNDVDYWPIEVWRHEVEYPELKHKLCAMYAEHRPDAVGVEEAASGMALVQELRRQTAIPIVAIPARGSKEARAEAITPVFESGHVIVPHPDPDAAPWVNDWVEEHIAFPAGRYNDQVDTTSLALARLKVRGRRELVFGKVSGQRTAVGIG